LPSKIGVLSKRIKELSKDKARISTECQANESSSKVCHVKDRSRKIHNQSINLTLLACAEEMTEICKILQIERRKEEA
jgi:hypothetical protein